MWQLAAAFGAVEGEDVHVLGFPIGVLSDQLFGPERSYLVARRGSIAWIRPALDKVNREFLIDSFIFPATAAGRFSSLARLLWGRSNSKRVVSLAR